MLGSNGNCLDFRKSGPLTQLLDCETSADIPWVPASARLSLEATWFHSSTLVCSKIFQARFALIIGCLVVEVIHCKTVVLSVHMKTLLTFNLRSRQISWFNRAASRTACYSSFGTVITFVDAAQVLPRTTASAIWDQFKVFNRARRNATARTTSCELSPHICNSRSLKVPEK